MKPTAFVSQFLRAFWRRLRHEGLRPTLVWLYGRGVPWLTGVPMLPRYSRITPALFIGPQHRRLGKRKLQRLGIRHSVSLRAEFDDAAHGLALDAHCYLPTIDGTAPTLQQLREGVRFIQEALRLGGKVYVHCEAGIGRAPTLAVAFLIAEGWDWKEAIAHVVESRPFVNLAPEQLEQLEKFALSHL